MSLKESFRLLFEEVVRPLLPPKNDGSAELPPRTGEGMWSPDEDRIDHLSVFIYRGNFYHFQSEVRPVQRGFKIEFSLSKHEENSPYASPGVEKVFTVLGAVGFESAAYDPQDEKLREKIKTAVEDVLTPLGRD